MGLHPDSWCYAALECAIPSSKSSAFKSSTLTTARDATLAVVRVRCVYDISVLLINLNMPSQPVPLSHYNHPHSPC